MITILCNSAESLRNALSTYTTFAVVEAEYGSDEVRGSADFLSLNHHVRPERPCPCTLPNSEFALVRDQIEAVGISHFDLDTLGGWLALQGQKPDNDRFWSLAAWVDINGPHRVKECPDFDQDTFRKLASFWGWSQENRLFAPRDGSLSYPDEFLRSAQEELCRILGNEEDALERGINFLAKEDSLKKESYRDEGLCEDGMVVVLRSHDGFTNHLYSTQNGLVAHIVVAYQTKARTVVVSSDKERGIDCREFVQSLWGPEAGGHFGIAGSPRGREMTFEDAHSAFTALLER